MRVKSLADHLADLDDPTPKDFDPEDLDYNEQDSDGDKDPAADPKAGREHYQILGKGNLRRQDPISLGKQYAGKHISRYALAAESDSEQLDIELNDASVDRNFEESDELEGSEDDSGCSSEPAKPGTLPQLSDASDDSSSDGIINRLAVAERTKRNKVQLQDDSDKAKNGNRPSPLNSDLDDLKHVQRFNPTNELLVKPDDSIRKPQYSLGGRLENNIESNDSGVKEMDNISDRHGYSKSRRHVARLRRESNEQERDDDSEGSISEDDHDRDSDEAETSHNGLTGNVKVNHGEGISGSKSADEREELRRLLSSDQKMIASEIARATKGDVEKGRAVRKQQSTFDALLNARIKVQKGLGPANQLLSMQHKLEGKDVDTIKSAESAALALWSTLENLRFAMADVQSNREHKKHKRPPSVSSVAVSTASLWKRMEDLESDSVVRRREILEKWSLKVRGSSKNNPSGHGKLFGSTSGGQQNNISAVLGAHIASESGERSAKRARRENSDQDTCPIYDDTTFYQSLLRDLIEQHMSSDPTADSFDNLHFQLPSRLPIHPVTNMRNDKAARDVDTRASKGRKMRYHVHEKLQNFMAPEERGTWTDRAREELFASLLGKTASGMLGESNDGGDITSDDEDIEEGGLKLFRGE